MQKFKVKYYFIRNRGGDRSPHWNKIVEIPDGEANKYETIQMILEQRNRNPYKLVIEKIEEVEERERPSRSSDYDDSDYDDSDYDDSEPTEKKPAFSRAGCIIILLLIVIYIVVGVFMNK